ncbi:YdgA family protein [Neisseria sp. Ec49-e6-T10]|uniref:YdgA family protein n=1 Tax=Neisseria sp. Ec49-e6-T10 TaxID=3140744 RepID=UPI003EB9488A
MNKRLKIILSLVVLFAVFLLALPYYMGVKAKQTLDKQFSLIQNTSWLEVVSHDYQRGWFSSTEVTTVKIKPSVIAAYKDMLPEQLKALVDKSVTYTNVIHHGPFPRLTSFVFEPGNAYVRTQFSYTEDTRKTLSRFFQDKEPITITNHLNFTGGGQLQLTIPNFDYSELSGIKVNWKGLQYQLDYQQNYEHYQVKANTAGLEVILADKGQLIFKDMAYENETHTGQTGINLGKNKFSLATLNLGWKEGINYHIQLNEVLSLLTKIQVGSFINPTGKIGPAELTLNNLKYEADIGEQDKFINAVGQFSFDKLTYGNEVYGPLQIKISGEHLDGISLHALSNKLGEIATQNLGQDEAREAILNAAKKEGLGLWENDPVINIETFKLKMPSGLLDVKGKVAFNNITEADLEDFNALVAKINLNMELYVPQKALESLAAAQADMIFSVDERAEDQPDMEEIKNLASGMISSFVSAWEQEGYLTLDGGIIHTTLQLKNDQFTINGKKFEVQDDSEILDSFDEEDQTATASEVKESSSAP